MSNQNCKKAHPRPKSHLKSLQSMTFCPLMNLPNKSQCRNSILTLLPLLWVEVPLRMQLLTLLINISNLANINLKISLASKTISSKTPLLCYNNPSSWVTLPWPPTWWAMTPSLPLLTCSTLPTSCLWWVLLKWWQLTPNKPTWQMSITLTLNRDWMWWTSTTTPCRGKWVLLRVNYPTRTTTGTSSRSRRPCRLTTRASSRTCSLINE